MRALRLTLVAFVAALTVFVPTAVADDDDGEGAAVCGPNLVVNGDFEAPPAGPTFMTYFAPSNIAGWTVESGSVDHIGGYWQPASGLQSLDLNGLAPGTISQLLTTVPGRSYVLEFAVAGNPDGPPTTKTMNVRFGGTVFAVTFDLDGATKTSMGWMYANVVVQATAAVTELEFESTTNGQLLPAFGPALDDVSVCQLSGGDDDDDDDGDDDDGDDDDNGDDG